MTMHPVTIQGNDFVCNGRPIQLLSGAMHYFRVVPEYWRDRLLKLKAMGLNTVETYVAWDLHEPRPGRFNFAGNLDLVHYLELAAELGLKAIVRPGPYMCSEWDLGGLPPWLLKDPNMRLRCAYPPYLKAVDRFFDALLAPLVPLQAANGGPLIALQVENEYGSYGNDKTYLRHLADGLRRRGITELLFTSDGDSDCMLQGGTLPDLHKVVNFGSDPERNFRNLRRYQPTGPLMCGEFWNGWFDHWGETHHRRDAADAAACLDQMLASGASVNLYMFHGGSNFGFMNGANHTGTEYQPTINSYDFDAPLTECGDITPKYLAYREVIAKYHPLPDIALPPSVVKRAYGEVTLTETAPLLANLELLAKPVQRAAPVPMEMLDQNYGFIHYRTIIQGPRETNTLNLQEVHDRALVFLNGEYRGVIDRDGKEAAVQLAFGPGAHQLDILVENMGRVNYGTRLHDRKGITEGVRIGDHYLFDWTIFPLPLTNLRKLRFGPEATVTGPAFHRGIFRVDAPADTFLALPGWTKGVAWINGFNLGRYWEAKGPQRTLYVPAPKLRRGRNELIVLELHDPGPRKAQFRDTPDLG